MNPIGVDPDEARDVACSVTEGGDVCQIPEVTAPTPIDTGRGTGVGGGGGFGLLLVILLVAALIVGLAWLARTWLAGGFGVGGDDEDPDDLDADVDELLDERIVDHETPPDRWRRRAAEHRAAGEYREAIRCEYRALVGDLARAGFVDEIPGRTSGEEREQIDQLAPHAASDFRVAADLFDEAWFNDDDVLAVHDEWFVAAERTVLGR